MNTITGSLKQYKPIVYNEKTKSYTVSWGLRNIGDQNYQWNYKIFNFKPSLLVIKDTINSAINERTKSYIVNNFRWNGMSIYLSLEKQIDYTLLFNTTLLLDGSNLPEQVKFRVNGENVYYTFENIDDMKDFMIAMNNHIRMHVANGNKAKEEVNYDEYKL